MRKFISTIAFLFLLTGFAQISFAGVSLIPATSGERQFSFELVPGQEQAANVILENLSDAPVTVHLYGADGTQSNQGSYALTTLAVEQRHIGKWVTFPQPFQELDPRQKKEITLLIKVPSTTTPGVYSGGIAAEVGGAKSENAGSGSAVSVSSRIVVKLFVSVPGEKVHTYDWSEFSYNPGIEPQKPFFKLSYINLGNTVILASQELEISGFPDQEKVSMSLPAATLLGGNQVDIIQKWPEQPFWGFYKATATVTFSEYDVINNKKLGGETVIKEMNIYVPLNLDTTPGKIVLVTIIVILALLMAALVWAIAEMNFRKKCSTYTVQPGETLTGIGDKFNTNWKKLAKINKLKPPYNLKPGQKILAPTGNKSK